MKRSKVFVSARLSGHLGYVWMLKECAKLQERLQLLRKYQTLRVLLVSITSHIVELLSQIFV